MHHLLPDTMLSIYCLHGNVPDNWPYPPSLVGIWPEDGYSFLFFTDPEPGCINALITSHGDLELVDYYQLSYQQWQGSNREPVKIGRFLIAAPGLDINPNPGEILITLDAGLVFGNGTHPTTATCLAAIEAACAMGPPVQRVADLGTGTGLLALAAARLTPARVLAVDFNMLAARTARYNVLLNGLGNRILVVNGTAQQAARWPSDLMVANIGYTVLREMLLDGVVLLHRRFIFSGLQTAEAADLRSLLVKLPVVVLNQWQQDGLWHTFLGAVR